jgi:hypothetical protein
MWIDALSIDQSNLDERSHQVSMMGQIYSSAFRVTVWLGLGNENIRAAMQIMKNLTSESCETYEPSDDRRRLDDEQSPPRSCITDPIFWPRVLEWLELPYWRRAWILQEYALAQKTLIRCGADSLDETVIANFSSGLDSCAHFDNTGQTAADKFAYQHFLRTQCPAMQVFRFKRQHRQNNTDLWQILSLAGRRLECTDPRDRVYSALSLLSITDRKRLAIATSYTTTASELFQNIVSVLEPERMQQRNQEFQGWILWCIDSLREGLGLNEDDAGVQKALEELKERHGWVCTMSL